MNSLFSKVRATVLGHTHDLLDKVIDIDSIPVIKQYVRDLEEALDKMRHEAAAAAAHVTTLHARRTQINRSVDQEKAKAVILLKNSDEQSKAAARAAAGKIHDAQEELGQLAEEISAAEQNSAALDKAVTALGAKHDQMLRQVRMLESKDRSARAMNAANAGLKQAQDLSALDVAGNIDNVSARIDERHAVAQEEFNRNLAAMGDQSDPVRESAVDDILSSLTAEAEAPTPQ